MSDELGPVVQQIVNDAADEAVESVREEHAVETAAERVEDAAERVEAAAASVHAEPSYLTRDDLHAVLSEHLSPVHARIDALENPAPPVEDVAQETAEATVAEIAERVEEQAEQAEDELEGGALGETPDVPDVETPDVSEAVAEVVDADVPPKKSHFMHRPLFGG